MASKKRSVSNDEKDVKERRVKQKVEDKVVSEYAEYAYTVKLGGLLKESLTKLRKVAGDIGRFHQNKWEQVLKSKAPVQKLLKDLLAAKRALPHNVTESETTDDVDYGVIDVSDQRTIADILAGKPENRRMWVECIICGDQLYPNMGVLVCVFRRAEYKTEDNENIWGDLRGKSLDHIDLYLKFHPECKSDGLAINTYMPSLRRLYIKIDPRRCGFTKDADGYRANLRGRGERR